MSILSKVDVRAIWGNHLATLRDERTGKTSVSDILLFFGTPATVALALFLIDVRVSTDALNVLTNALAILAGLLFNLLVVLQSVRWPPDHPLKKTALQLATESYNNIAYAIVVSLLTLVFLVPAANYPPASTGRLVLGTVAAFLVMHFALTMFMVLKRMHAML